MKKSRVALKAYNTFGVEAYADDFVEITSIEQLKAVLSDRPKSILVLGGGSNMLFTSDYRGSILYINNKGINIIEDHDRQLTARVAAGEIWHDLVMWAVERNLSGIENLALIPGKVGAAPVQNIGAYGVEFKDCMSSCQTIDIATGNIKNYENKDCHFSYRDSIFKTLRKDRDIIVSVDITLRKAPHKLHTGYGDIKRVLLEKNITDPTPEDIARTIISIRQAKLPDPNILGNAGSFFKNVVLSKISLQKILTNYPDIPCFNLDKNLIKIPTAWLIERCNLKGFRRGNVGTHIHQPLVIVNHGNAKGSEILSFAAMVKDKVKEKFDITITPEVCVI